MASTSGTTQSGPVVDRVSLIVTPIVSDLGLDLYDLEFAGGILRVTRAPYRSAALERAAARHLRRVMDHLDYAGVLTIAS